MLLAALQGVSELFPISSLGHTVLLPWLLRWPVDRSDPTFLAFVVALHFGTALALVVFYRRDWRRFARKNRRRCYRSATASRSERPKHSRFSQGSRGRALRSSPVCSPG